MICAGCGQGFEPHDYRQRYCHKRCRVIGFRKRNPEGWAAIAERYETKNRAARRRAVREWQEKNRDAMNARRRERYARDPVHRAKIKAAHRKSYAAHADRYKTAATNRKRTLRAGGPLDPTWAAALANDPCSYCPAPADEIDHIVPVVDGGTNIWLNLTAACRACNRRKFTHSLLHFLAAER